MFHFTLYMGFYYPSKKKKNTVLVYYSLILPRNLLGVINLFFQGTYQVLLFYASRELQRLRRKSSTPSVSPLQSPQKQHETVRAEGNPVIIDGIGRESPEGTSDNEEASGGGGFVMVTAAHTSPQVPGGVSRETADSTVKGALESVDDAACQVPQGSDVIPLGGYDDPSDSIEALIQKTSESTEDLISERLTEAIENERTLEMNAEVVHDSSVKDTISVSNVSVTEEDSTLADSHDTKDLAIEKTSDEYLEQLRSEAKKLLRVSTSR